MKAARFYGPGDLRVEEIDEPIVGPGQVKLRNAYVGVCGTDVHLYFAPESARAFFERPHPLTGASAPQVLGHEFSGTVVEVGDGVTEVAPGDTASVYPVYSCGRCAACTRGRPNACRTVAFHGISSHGGGMAEFTVVDTTMLHRLPEGVDLRQGALVEPMAVGWHAVEVGEARPGESALIAGAGPIGIGVWFALREHGVEHVVVSEPNPRRRDAIATLGAAVVDPAVDDLGDVVAELTAGAGVDLAFDAAGVGVALTSALAQLRAGGRLVAIATHAQPISLDASLLTMGGERSIRGSLAYLHRDFDAVISAMAGGRYDTSGWVDDFPLDQAEQVLQDLHEGRGIKHLVQPDR